MYERKCCVPNCLRTRADKFILHSFPNPKKELGRFNKWIYAIGGNLYVLDQFYIFKCGKVCHSHFEEKYYTRSNRLSPNAIPTLGLSGITLPTSPSLQEVEKNSRKTLPDDLTSGNSNNFKLTSSIPNEAIGSTLRVQEADNATINSHIYTEIEKTEEVTPNCDGPNACDELQTEYAKSNNVVDQFLIINQGAENSLLVSEQVDNCVSQENAVINGDVYNEVTTKEFIPDCEGPNDCYDVIEKTDNICDVIDEFLTMPAINEGSLIKTEERENGIKEEEIQSAEMLSYKICDSCNEKITGLRYKCLQCVDYNHCHKCEMLEAHADHYMMRMPRFQIAEYIIDRMYHEIKPIVASLTYSYMLGTIPFYNEPDNNNSNDSEVDLSEDEKSLIRNEVTRAVKKKREFKTYRSKTNKGKIKRIMKMPDHASKRRKTNVHINTCTTEIKDEIQAIVDMEPNDNVPDTFENADENSKDLEADDESTPVIASIEHDPTCPGAVHMALSSDVSRLIMEVIKDGKKILYQYVDS